MDMKFDSINEWSMYIKDRLDIAVEDDKLLQLTEMVLNKKIKYDFMGFVTFDTPRFDLITALEIDIIADEIELAVLREEIFLSKFNCYDVEELLDKLIYGYEDRAYN